MLTSVDVDDGVMAAAMRATGAKTESEAIQTALREITRLKQQESLITLWGIGWEGDLNDMRTSKYIPE